MAVFGTEARVRRGEDYPELSSDDLFDRIINLKFVRWDTSEFVIRSDYEPVFQKDGSIQFAVCRPKPRIKVSYKQVSEDTAIRVEIEVAGLFIDKTQGDPLTVQNEAFQDSLDPTKGNPVTNIVVQLGYRGQFPDWTDPLIHRDPHLYYALYNPYVKRGEEAKSGMELLVTVLNTDTEGAPPDQITRFNGIIGTAETGLLWSHTEEDLIKTTADFEPDKNGKPYLYQELYQWITRRFIRPDILHRVVTKYDAEGRIVPGEQRVYIYDLAGYRKKLQPPDIPPWKPGELAAAQPSEAAPWKVEAAAQQALASAAGIGAPVPGAAAPEEQPGAEWEELALVDGILSEDDAELFGLPCRLSARLLSFAMTEKPAYGAVHADSGTLLPRQIVLTDDPRNTIASQINAFQDAYGCLRYFVMPDGGYYFYHEDEQKEDLFMNTRIQGLLAANNGGVRRAYVLPAVYDIAYGGTRTIRCPFFHLIAPMTVLFFSARYYTGSLVGFYYRPEKKDAKYLVLQASIEFATDGEENTMTLMCVDYPDDKPPFLEDGKPVFELSDGDKKALAPGRPAREAAWETINLVVTPYARMKRRKIAEQTLERWLDIIHHCLLLPLGYPSGLLWRMYWKDYLDKSRAWVYKRALSDLKEWNPAYFTAGRLAEPSPENREWEVLTRGAEDGPVLAVPVLKPEEAVVYRWPWMPSYEGEGREL
jgi:hypothetical protein